jgi:hypothetical protein
MKPSLAAIVLSVLCIASSSAPAATSKLLNPTKQPRPEQVIRLLTPAPGKTGSFVVKEDGKEISYQVETIDGKDYIWICTSFEPQSEHAYEVVSGRPAKAKPRVSLKKEGGFYVLDNGEMAVRVPAEAKTGEVPGPIAGVKLGGKFVGRSAWQTDLKLKRFTAEVIGDGTVMAKVRLRYEFDGQAGLLGESPAAAEFDVSLGPGWKHAEVFERHAMRRGDYWEFEASYGWSPREGVSKPFSRGAGSGSVESVPSPNRALRPIKNPSIRPDMYINLFPRWNQHFKDGWAFAATDGEKAVGAVVARAGQWIWPHENSIEIVVKPSGDYAGFRCRTWTGQRLWWLTTSLAPVDIGYVGIHAFENLDKLNHDLVLDWPGAKPGWFSINWYDGGQVNPTGGIRGQGRAAVANAGKPGDLATLIRVQILMHPDGYGSYWNFWSPENPNFFTDFYRVPVALTSNLKSHPQFERFRAVAVQRVREDIYHSITLPGGAGQECPGYLGHGWLDNSVSKVCREHLGFDPAKDPRVAAGARFLRRISQPDGAGKRLWLHIGDTHPKGHWEIDVPADEVRKFATEELPGFGVIFNNRPGTDRETYLSFKAGPNRGHYHGDQLAFHYCAHARAVAVDHHCSYGPRAGQEHMHNRLAFFTKELPYANMDGYERLIALKTTPGVDVAVGQVESNRLREIEKLPPETWHHEWPQQPLDKPLVYRRTVVFVKGGPEDYFVFRDQFWSPIELGAAYCLHVRSDKIEHKGQTVDFGNLRLFCAAPAKYAFVSFPWQHENGPPESTQGARLEIRGTQGEFITVLHPGKPPTMEAIPGGVKVGDDEITFAGDQPTAGDAVIYATVKRGGKTVLTLTGKDIDLDRSQGEIGLFVPDAGYPFGDIPEWLIRQRLKRPDWAKGGK